jgi:hypothetical protein
MHQRRPRAPLWACLGRKVEAPTACQAEEALSRASWPRPRGGLLAVVAYERPANLVRSPNPPAKGGNRGRSRLRLCARAGQQLRARATRKKVGTSGPSLKRVRRTGGPFPTRARFQLVSRGSACRRPRSAKEFGSRRLSAVAFPSGTPADWYPLRAALLPAPKCPTAPNLGP